jgi:microcystin-dependent protein
MRFGSSSIPFVRAPGIYIFIPLSALGITAILGVHAWAGGVSVPDTFDAGDLLTAAKLNADFQTLQNAINANATPPGTVVAFAGPTVPSGWLLCDGSAVSRTTYAGLFGAIGVANGGGDGTTTFNLPDYRGLFLRGVDGAAGRDPESATRASPQAGVAAVTGGAGNPGNLVGSVEEDALQDHYHMLNGIAAQYYPGADDMLGGTYATRVSGGQISQTQSPANANLASETRPRNVYVNYLIKF